MITEFRVGCARTINLGNYESLRIEASVTVDVPVVEGSPNDVAANLEDLKGYAQVELRRLMELTYREQHKASKDKGPY